MKIKQLLRILASPRLTLAPTVVLVGVAILVVCSYIFASWLMRPVGDDYGALLAYHIDASWIKIFPETVINGGGRYGQTIIGMFLYGQLGERSLQIAGVLSTGLLLVAGYMMALAWQKCAGWTRNHKVALAVSLVVFVCYTLLSVVFPWTRGGIDNTFQNMLWLPGFLTYTLPVELVAIMVATVILLPQTYLNKKWVLVVLGLAAIFTGTFSEMVPIIFTEALVLVGLYYLAVNRFRRAYIMSRLKSWLPLIIIEVGLIVGLLLNYLSPATSARQAIFQEQATIGEILVRSWNFTIQYLQDYTIGGSADPKAIALCLISGAALGILLVRLQRPNLMVVARQLGLLSLFSLVMGISSIFICFAVVFKGYGISSYIYLLPRFEILYNLWVALFFLLIGALFACGVAIVAARKRIPLAVPVFSVLVTLAVAAGIPYMMGEAAYRLRIVASFSAAWQQQTNQLREDAKQGVDEVTVPVIDIGDAYNFNCDASPDRNWLGVAKEDYYDIDRICSTPE